MRSNRIGPIRSNFKLQAPKFKKGKLKTFFIVFIEHLSRDGARDKAQMHLYFHLHFDFL